MPWSRTIDCPHPWTAQQHCTSSCWTAGWKRGTCDPNSPRLWPHWISLSVMPPASRWSLTTHRPLGKLSLYNVKVCFAPKHYENPFMHILKQNGISRVHSVKLSFMSWISGFHEGQYYLIKLTALLIQVVMLFLKWSLSYLLTFLTKW